MSFTLKEGSQHFPDGRSPGNYTKVSGPSVFLGFVSRLLSYQGPWDAGYFLLFGFLRHDAAEVVCDVFWDGKTSRILAE